MSSRAGTFSIRAATVAGPGNSICLRRHVYFGRAEAVLLERERIKGQRNRKPSLAASTAVDEKVATGNDLSNAPRPLRLPLQLMVRVEAEVAAQGGTLNMHQV